MKKIIAMVMFLGLTAAACGTTESDLAPEQEPRDIEVNSLDLEVLLKANNMLPSEDHWSKDDSQKCEKGPQHKMDDGLDGYDLLGLRMSLYCALHASTVETIGTYVHRLPALQEVRFTIADNYPQRWKAHRLADFNAHPQTTFYDIKRVLDLTIQRVKQKLESQKKNNPK